MLKRFIGNKQFYKHLVLLMIPIVIQNGLTNFVNMLDNVMIGKYGTVEMVGVSITNQLMFVYNLCIFGAVSGAGIFGAQFFGNRDIKGVRDTFRFKVLFCTAITVLMIAVFAIFDDGLLNLYLKGESEIEDALGSLAAGKTYLAIMLIGLIPAAIVQCYTSTLRETGKTLPPMISGVIAIAVNLALNYVLIFGKFGAPQMGVAGAAIATVVSRFIECTILVLYTQLTRHTNAFIIGAYKSFKVPMSIVKGFVAKGLPLMANETLFAAGHAIVHQSYSLLGYDVVIANNVVHTFFGVFSVVFMSAGVAIGIILGQELGAGKTDTAKDHAIKYITFAVMISVVIGVIFAIAAEFIPELYDIDSTATKLLATRMMQISALCFPLGAFANACYFTLRSGGKMSVTIIFDSGFIWCILVPVAFVLCRYTSLTIIPIFAICQGLDIVKCLIGGYFFNKGDWIKKIVN